MPIVPNSNSSATSAPLNLTEAGASLKSSLERLPSGQKINRLDEDAGGMTVASSNFKASHGRIMYTEITAESTRFARSNIIIQSSASMTAQANQLSSFVLTLIE
tara:strand:- start:35 stop:346 length:312 start_codon:yes stop_codon:yes gene_type:complete